MLVYKKLIKLFIWDESEKIKFLLLTAKLLRNLTAVFTGVVFIGSNVNTLICIRFF